MGPLLGHELRLCVSGVGGVVRVNMIGGSPGAGCLPGVRVRGEGPPYSLGAWHGAWVRATSAPGQDPAGASVPCPSIFPRLPRALAMGPGRLSRARVRSLRLPAPRPRGAAAAAPPPLPSRPSFPPERRGRAGGGRRFRGVSISYLAAKLSFCVSPSCSLQLLLSSEMPGQGKGRWAGCPRGGPGDGTGWGPRDTAGAPAGRGRCRVVPYPALCLCKA